MAKSKIYFHNKNKNRTYEKHEYEFIPSGAGIITQVGNP